MAAPRQSTHFTTSFDGVRLAYAVTGKGPPIVKVPSWLTHLDYDWQNPIFRIQAESAAACIPGARLLVARGERHGWPTTDPASFNAAVRTFIEAHP
jgi:hypothetical protein